MSQKSKYGTQGTSQSNERTDWHTDKWTQANFIFWIPYSKQNCELAHNQQTVGAIFRFWLCCPTAWWRFWRFGGRSGATNGTTSISPCTWWAVSMESPISFSTQWNCQKSKRLSRCCSWESSWIQMPTRYQRRLFGRSQFSHRAYRIKSMLARFRIRSSLPGPKLNIKTSTSLLKRPITWDTPTQMTTLDLIALACTRKMCSHTLSL